MSGEVKVWPKQGRPTDKKPQKIKRPCDWSLEGAIMEMETQLGTIEAYNRLVEATENLKALIGKGEIKPQNSIYAKSIRGE